MGHEAHADQDHGDDPGGGIVVGDRDALVHQRLQHQHLGAAEDRRGDIGGERADEDQRAADHQPLAGQRQQDAPEHRPPRGAEHLGRRHHIGRQVLQRADQRQYHQREEQLDQAEEDRRLAEQEADRLVRQAQPGERHVDDAGAAEDHQPGIGPRHRRDHQRQHQEADQLALHPGRGVDDHQRHGIADHRRHRRDRQRQAEGAEEHVAVQRLGEELGEVLQPQPAAEMEAAGQQDRDRQQEADHDEQRRGRHQGQADASLLEHAPTARPWRSSPATQASRFSSTAAGVMKLRLAAVSAP